MSDFGRARGLAFTELEQAPAHVGTSRPLGSSVSFANDVAAVDAIEAELEQARTALSALEEASAIARLTRVESQLLAHPHLPQAAFLMGECLALQAQAAQEQSPVRALALQARRSALEGPRAAAFGAAATVAVVPEAQPITIGGLDVEDELELDAVAVADRRQLRLAPGLHHARVWRHDRLVFATFFELAAAQTALELAVPSVVACGAEDLAHAATVAPPTESIACARWAKVRVEPRGIGVALCEHRRCSDFVHWERRAEPRFTPIRVERSAGLPTWAGVTIAGTAALLATGLVLWQSGAFSEGRPNAASWEYGGLNPQAIRF